MRHPVLLAPRLHDKAEFRQGLSCNARAGDTADCTKGTLFGYSFAFEGSQKRKLVEARRLNADTCNPKGIPKDIATFRCQKDPRTQASQDPPQEHIAASVKDSPPKDGIFSVG